MTALVPVSILVVDDDPMMRSLLEVLLLQLGYRQTVCVDSGLAALSHVLQHRDAIGVIFLDLNMPDMDGVEFIRKLAEHKFRGTVALVSGVEDRVLDAVTKLTGRLGLRSLGPLRKPVQLAQLAEMLRAVAPPAATATAMTDYRHPWAAEELSVAVRERQLLLHYQPLVSLATGKALGVEGLVRWQHPTHGLIPPDQFIAVAEETGVISEITRFVLAEGMRQSRAWADAGCLLTVSLNVSIGDLASLEFPDVAAALAQDAGVDPAAITLEVSEHQMIRQVGTALDVLSRLKLKRFRLAIDDFGTGYSSLAQLRDLPFDELKIDRGFVRRAPTTAKLRTICAASIQLAHELNMSVVAEGIESDAEWRLMRQLGVETGQGYGIARPMPAERIAAWCASPRPAGRRQGMP